MERCMESVGGGVQSMESTLTPVCPPPVGALSTVHCAVRTENTPAEEEKLEFCCADKSLLKAVTSVKK